MTLLLALLRILGGLAVLAFGGDVLVRGAVSLARRAGLTTAVIGLTVVAFGTSLPELTVSLMAALRDEPEIAVGNVIGSNIFNLLAILGFCAVLRPLPVHGNAVKIEWPVMMVVTALSLLLIRDRQLDQMEGGFLLFSLVVFVAFSVWLAKRQLKRSEIEQIGAQTGVQEPAETPARLLTAVALVVAGLASLVFGGSLLVDGSVSLARLIGLSETVIGLTIVAAGTSAPEVAASVMAARRGHSDIAIANLLGSNIFNLLGILGISALVSPIPVADVLAERDAWWMLGSAAALFPLMRVGRNIGRLEGLAMLAAYAAYLALLLSELA